MSIFNNIGKKIKTMALFLFGVLCFISAVVSIYMFYLSAGDWGEKGLAVVGFLTLIIGPILSFVSSAFLFGFGVLIETNERIADILSSDVNDNKNNEHNVNVQSSNKTTYVGFGEYK